jgi:tRNA (adenine22-N1)-methyltransferase
MKAVAAMVTPGGVLADIGTDHGYVPISLLQRQQIRGAIAMDINPGPLARAQHNIAAAHLEDSIETRLSDGVQKLQPGEADTILIAGMGGELTIHILEEGQKVCEAAGELILQPQSDIQKVRVYLREHHYKIVDEDMVCEDDKFYPMMRTIHVEENNVWEKMNEQTRTTCDIYGPLLLRNGNQVLRRFLVREHRQLTQILQQLEAHVKTDCGKTDAVQKRVTEVQQKLRLNESAYTILGAIKNAGI